MNETLPARISKAEIPQRYEAARTALEKCVEVDECKEWADKAKALATYAMQSKDESLYKMAVRIRARAIQRAGQLLAEIEPKPGERTDKHRWHCGRCGHRLNSEDEKHLCQPGVAGGTRYEAANQAGLSRRQRVTALRVANVPEEDFERAVESDRPPSIKALAERGKVKRPIVVRECNDPEVFAASTRGQAALGALYEVVKNVDPIMVADGASKRERATLELRATETGAWLGKLVRQIRRTRS